MYPRDVTRLELSLLELLLPEDSPGYRPYRDFLSEAVVIGEGRRGEGEIILGRRGESPDFGSPLGPVFSYGVAETPGDLITITVREMTDRQVSVEIVGRETDAVPEGIFLGRKWTYATWKPGNPCPQCSGAVREVPVGGGDAPGGFHTLAVCVADRRVWVFDADREICRPIPLTNYYNELMLLKNIRDPETALDGNRLFEQLGRYSDGELGGAFAAYNRLMTKIPGIVPRPVPAPSGEGLIRKLLRKLTG